MTSATETVRKTALTTWEGIWYVLQNIALGAGYFAKVPAKKAMSDFGLTDLTGAEHFWYVLMCIGFGAGYFAKIPTAKALSDLPQFRAQREENLGTLSQVPSSSSTQLSPPPNVPPEPLGTADETATAESLDDTPDTSSEEEG